MPSITQEMKYRESLMKYVEKNGVSRASRKYNKGKSYIYFWKNRYDGTIDSLRERSTRPHHHISEHTDEELTLIKNLVRRNPDIGLMDLWYKLKARDYKRSISGLYKALKRLKIGLNLGVSVLCPAANNPHVALQPLTILLRNDAACNALFQVVQLVHAARLAAKVCAL